MHPDPWRDEAACLGEDIHLFFPDRDDDTRYNEARIICARCPVRDACLDFAIETRERFGFWGGKSWAERKQIARKRREAGRPAEHGTSAGHARHLALGETPCDACAAHHGERCRSYRTRRREPAA